MPGRNPRPSTILDDWGSVSWRVPRDVGRLQVPVHNAFFVGCGKGIAKSSGDLDDLLKPEAALWNQPVERQSFHQLHGEEMHAIAFFDRINGDDIGMIELSERLRLAEKAPQPRRILCQVGG